MPPRAKEELSYRDGRSFYRPFHKGRVPVSLATMACWRPPSKNTSFMRRSYALPNLSPLVTSTTNRHTRYMTGVFNVLIPGSYITLGIHASAMDPVFRSFFFRSLSSLHDLGRITNFAGVLHSRGGDDSARGCTWLWIRLMIFELYSGSCRINGLGW